MWVRSQDKKSLVDVKGCYMFTRWSFKKGQENYEFRITGLMSEPSVEGCSWVLGDYKTQEKAMSVLDELQCRIARSESGVFQMPEGDDEG